MEDWTSLLTPTPSPSIRAIFAIFSQFLCAIQFFFLFQPKSRGFIQYSEKEFKEGLFLKHRENVDAGAEKRMGAIPHGATVK